MMKEIIVEFLIGNMGWINLTLNVVLCSSVLIIGVVQTKKMRLYSKIYDSYQLRAHIPTIWTSLGILGTFVSILISLLIFALVDSNDINGLIYNIAPAFSTSIIGIGGSIITSIQNKYDLASIESEEDERFKKHQEENHLSGKNSAYSPELILLEILREIKEGNSSLSSKIGAFQDDLIQKEGHVYDAIVKGSETTRNTITNALEIQKNDFTKVVGEMGISFNKALEKQNGTLGSKMDQIRAAFEGIIKDLVSKVQDNIVQESKDRTKQLTEYIDTTTKEMKLFVANQSSKYESIQNNLLDIVSKMRELFEEDVKNSIEEFAKEQHTISQETIAEWNTRLTNETKITIDEFVLSVKQKFEELHSKQNELLDTLISNNKAAIDKSLEENKQSIAAILKTNKEAMEKVSGQMRQDCNDIKDTLATTQKNWKEESARIEAEHASQIIAIHKQTKEEISEIQTKITEIEGSLKEKLQKIAETITVSTTNFEQKLNEAREDATSQQEETIKQLSQRIRDVFPIGELQSAGTNLLNGINKTLYEFKNNTTKVSSDLENVSSSIKDSAQKYSDTIKGCDSKLNYIDSTLNLLKEHITDIYVLEQLLKDIEKSIGQVEGLKEDIQKLNADVVNSKKENRNSK